MQKGREGKVQKKGRDDVLKYRDQKEESPRHEGDRKSGQHVDFVQIFRNIGEDQKMLSPRKDDRKSGPYVDLVKQQEEMFRNIEEDKKARGARNKGDGKSGQLNDLFKLPNEMFGKTGDKVFGPRNEGDKMSGQPVDFVKQQEEIFRKLDKERRQQAGGMEETLYHHSRNRDVRGGAKNDFQSSRNLFDICTDRPVDAEMCDQDLEVGGSIECAPRVPQRNESKQTGSLWVPYHNDPPDILRRSSAPKEGLDKGVEQAKQDTFKKQSQECLKNETKPLPPSPPQIPKAVSSLCACPICFNLFSDPKSLQCEHHFCKDCLGELIKFDEKSVPFINCPTCHSVHTFDAPDSTLDSLKCQLVMKQILDSLGVHLKAEEVEDGIQCCNQSVSWYCGDCTQYLCGNCAQRHKHCWNTTAVRYCRSKEMFLPFCVVHKVLKYYGCTTCACPVCPFCTEKEHKDHMVLSFGEYAEKFEGYLQNKVDSTKNYNQQVTELLQSKKNDAKNTIKKKTSDIIALVREVEKELLIKADAVQQNVSNQLSEKMKKNQGVIEKAENLSKQGKVGIVFGTPKLLEMNPTCTVELEGVAQDEVNGIDRIQAFLGSMYEFFGNIEYTSVDMCGNVSRNVIQ